MESNFRDRFIRFKIPLGRWNDGTYVDPWGIEWDDYMRNPVVTVYGGSEKPVGRCVDIARPPHHEPDLNCLFANVVLDRDFADRAKSFCFEPYVEPSIQILETREPSGTETMHGMMPKDCVVISRCRLVCIEIVTKPSRPLDKQDAQQ
jgi:hypothetical protein